MNQVLVKDNKYSGQYVVLNDYDNPIVVASGSNPELAYATAIEKGCQEPVLIFVPDKDLVQIYLNFFACC